MRTVSTTIGGKRLGLAMAAFCLWASLGTAHAGEILWYNGDYDGNVGGPILNTVIPSNGNLQAFVYQEFIVPTGQTWTINQVYSNDEINSDQVTSAHWEIVTDVMPQMGATRIASGYADASLTKITSHEYTVTTTSPLGVTLAAGTYWLSVAPVVGKNHSSFILSTSGAGGMGVVTGNVGSSYVDGSYYTNINGNPPFDYASNVSGENPVGFSMGIIGTVASVPEPSTMVMGIIGTLTMLGYAWCRRADGTAMGPKPMIASLNRPLALSHNDQ